MLQQYIFMDGAVISLYLRASITKVIGGDQRGSGRSGQLFWLANTTGCRNHPTELPYAHIVRTSSFPFKGKVGMGMGLSRSLVRAI